MAPLKDQKNSKTPSAEMPLDELGDLVDLENLEEFDLTSLEQIEDTSSQQTGVDDNALIETYEELTAKKALKFIRDHIKDYLDYQTVPNRRATDQTFRQNITHYLNKTNDLLKEIHAMLIERQLMSSWAIAETLIGEIDLTVSDIVRGDYGFTTFFENPKLLEMDISQLYILDYELIETLKAMRERVLTFKQIIQKDRLEDVDVWFETIDRLVGRVIRLGEDRAKLIGSYERISYQSYSFLKKGRKVGQLFPQ